MRQRLFGGSLVATAAALVLASAGPVGAQTDTYAVSGLPAENVPIPTGNPGTHGFYSFFEFIYLTQTRAIGNQTVAYRGLVDSRGLITGVPGTYLGSGVEALNTQDFPRRGFQPGYNVGIGYKLDDGTSVHLSYMTQFNNTYHAGATLATPFARSNLSLSDTFLTSGVYNFPPQYAGPLVKTVADDTNRNGTADPGEGGNFYGIWNGASVMDIQFDQRFTEWEIGARVPLLQTEYSRIYGLAGGRFDWFMERFKWRTVSFDVSGQAGPRDVAKYTNTLSQRMYGPYVGCGHEIYVGSRFSMSLDLTGALLLDMAKERAKYSLGSKEIQNKLSRTELNLVPSAAAKLNLWWYPIEGVQLRVGYNAWTYFNTLSMKQPIGFNYSAIDPVYSAQGFRIVHGVNAGIGLFF